MDVKQEYFYHADIEGLIHDDPRLASLPGVYYEFREAAQDPELNFTGVEKIILKDPHLTAHLLKIVNSAFYSFSSKIETIFHAVSVIGAEQSGYLVLSTVVMDKSRRRDKHGFILAA